MPNHLSTHHTSLLQNKTTPHFSTTKPLHHRSGEHTTPNKKTPPRKGWGKEKKDGEEKNGAGGVEKRRVEGVWRGENGVHYDTNA